MIETTILNAAAGDADLHIRAAADVLRRGGLVAFPTETVYGLGADAFSAEAVAKVFEAKGRPPDNPLIVHIADIMYFFEIAETISPIAQKLADKFWPGPLTLVVRHRKQFPSIVVAGLPTVAVRMPKHPIALRLIRLFGRGIVGPSANLSGKPSPTTAQHVYDDLGGKIDIILDAGPTTIGVESTVIDVTTETPVILRLGGLPRMDLESVIGAIVTTREANILQRSPGTRHRHYAPRAPVELVRIGDNEDFAAALARHRGKRIGCILHSLSSHGVMGNLDVIAATIEEYPGLLFESLRALDQRGAEVILVESIPEVGVGEAVMDRLRRAAERA